MHRMNNMLSTGIERSRRFRSNQLWNAAEKCHSCSLDSISIDISMDINTRWLMRRKATKKKNVRAERWTYVMYSLIRLMQNKNGLSRDIITSPEGRMGERNGGKRRGFSEVNWRFSLLESSSVTRQGREEVENQNQATYSVSTIVISGGRWWRRWIELDDIRLGILAGCWHVVIQSSVSVWQDFLFFLSLSRYSDFY